MKERPILFSTPMVQAILEGRKTMTRRIVKPHPDSDSYSVSKVPQYIELENHWGKWSITDKNGETHLKQCPYGKPGDILWVKETFKPDEVDRNQEPVTWYYLADNPEAKRMGIKFKSALFMPKKAARIWLRITDVKIERLQQITKEDAVSEGVEFLDIDEPYTLGYKLYGNHQIADIFGRKAVTGTELESFHTLWQSINGQQSWDENPWVFVIEFKNITNERRTGNL